MSNAPDQSLLEALLNSWNRNNTIMVNLLHALPKAGLEARAMDGSWSIAKLFAHIHNTRCFFVSQTAPELTKNLVEISDHESDGWQTEHDFGHIVQVLNDSAKAVSDAVKARVDTGQEMRGTNIAYDHPILLLQHMLWHEGYHVGQMMLALKAAGSPMTDDKAVPLIWSVWVHEW